MLKRRRFLTGPEEAQVVAAIEAAEAGHRGEIMVHVEARCRGGDALARAGVLFDELGVGATRDGTGVLLYVAVDDRKTAVFAGSGVHGAAAPGFWQEVVDQVAEGFRSGAPTAGLTAAVGAAGDLLRRVVPGEDEAGDELPNRVSTG